jgi:hypothetical protein
MNFSLYSGLNGFLVKLGCGLAAVLFFAGCGSSSSGGTTCGNSTPCGGNIVGKWTVSSSCVSVTASAFDSTCPTATVTSSKLQVSGTFTYNADMTYTSSGTVSGSVVATIPASCLVIQGVTVTCAQINQVFQADPMPGVTLNCTGSSSCTCTETFTGTASAETGTFTTTAAGLLTTTSSDDTVTESDYCLKGATLVESPHAGSTMMGQSVTGTITLTKN